MSARVHANRARTAEETKGQEMAELAEGDVGGQEHVTVEEIDGLLEEIDSILEHNAEVFVRSYIQKGGE